MLKTEVILEIVEILGRRGRRVLLPALQLQARDPSPLKAEIQAQIVPEHNLRGTPLNCHLQLPLKVPVNDQIVAAFAADGALPVAGGQRGPGSDHAQQAEALVVSAEAASRGYLYRAEGEWAFRLAGYLLEKQLGVVVFEGSAEQLQGLSSVDVALG
jgi:hypothetical protein